MPTPDRVAVFLDRDGTLIHNVPYATDPGQVTLIPEAVAGLRRLRAEGFLLVLISNQSGVGRGLISSGEAAAVHARVVAELGREGIALDAIRYCPHAPEQDCDCRKPRPGMILDVARELDLDLASCLLIGDQPTDAQAGQAAGVRSVLLGAFAEGAVTVADWPEAVGLIDGLSI